MEDNFFGAAQNGDGSVANYSAEGNDLKWNFETGETERIIAELRAQNMLTDDGRIAEWDNVQSKPRTEYKAALRNRKKELSASGTLCDKCPTEENRIE